MRPTLRVRSLLVPTVLCLVGFFASSASAGPTEPVTVELPPEDQGEAFVPGVRLVEDLKQDYVEEEFFVSGTASVYNYANNPPLGPDDITPITGGIPYKTRLIVRRPTNAGAFRGTVVIEWWNSSADFDVAPVWDASAEYFARQGVIYVGVTKPILTVVVNIHAEVAHRHRPRNPSTKRLRSMRELIRPRS